ncbi:GAF domain-containing protein [Kribbella sp. VKM Ac-2569]|uniref:GAF and ANTAR domain-containing protein n=1 Tax=Kribbella sp. VKM Ac-2569 TaxID=2512220 RepID=UPI00102C77ED|nr:GAF and ANTAR domain-containing protein [Kribbella sp. VKM Ac-2569]RZT28024.1 GAF domain-containing protein [Kribbella sp. VKM Ac-2569]
MSRERRLASVFVELADTLVAGFDVIDFLHTLTERSVELLQADAAGLILVDPQGQLHVLASTTDEARLLELFELQNSEGPCLECFTAGQPVVNIDLAEVQARWPRFQAATTAAGYRSVHALPLRLRGQVIGAMNLFCRDRSSLSDDDIAVGQALADVATIGLLQERTVRHGEIVAEQLQGALNSRVLIEQAKGVLAERAGLGVDAAFAVLRTYARRNGRHLSEVAAAVIDGSLDLTTSPSNQQSR